MSESPRPSAGDEFSEAIEAQSFPWKIYDRWSHALAETFFSPSSSGAPVYLDLEDEALKEIAFKVHPDAAADPRGSLLQAVRRTLHRARPKDMFLPHVLRLRHWEKSDRVTPPPTIPLLAVLCLAAEDMRDGDGFAANNYYDRLMPLLDVGVERDKSNVIAGYRRDSFELWESLNFWLDDLGGARGLPTAFSLTHAHVGRPMSQALVRATDRDRFTELFSEAGFAPRSRIPPQELDPLLDEWISRTPSPVSHLLRAMWQRGDARERITEVACQVLENWTPTETLDTPAEAPSSARLRLVVAMRTFPRPSLELNIVGVLPRGTGAPTLVSSEDQARQIPTESAPGGWWTLAIPEEFDAQSLLEGQLSLLIPETSRSFDRRPRRLVPLVKDDLLNAFVEAERLQLGEDAVLLCRVELDAIVGRALELIARPGFKRWHSDSIGLPEGWILYSAVQALASLPDRDPATGMPWRADINLLQPLATTQAILQGGFAIPGPLRRWATLAPPELRVTTEVADALDIKVKQVRRFDGHATLELHQQFDSPVAVMPLGALGLGEGDYELTVRAQKNSKWKPINILRVRLRSANQPDRIGPPSIVRCIAGEQTWVLSAAARSSDEFWAGAFISRVTEGRPHEDHVLDPGTPAWWERRLSRAPIEREREVVSVRFVPTGDCFRTGEHYIQLPAYSGRTSGSTIEGVCRDCGLIKRYPARYRITSTRRAKKAILRPTFSPQHAPPIEARALDASAYDLALDGLSFVFGGSYGWLRQLASQLDASALFADQFARTMESLGFVEISRDRATLLGSSWEIAPPTLLESGDCYTLVGFRSARLREILESAVAEASGTVEASHGSGGPTIIRVRGLNREAIDALGAKVSRELGLELYVCHDGIARMLSALPPLSEVLMRLPALPMPGVSRVKKWDASTASWIPADDAGSIGSFRVETQGVRYIWRSAEDLSAGTMHAGDVRLVKYVEAARCRESLVGYDATTQSMYVPLGAELPAAYGRVAALVAGLPEIDQGQRLASYRGIPSRIAGHIAWLLMN